ncbi:hypothetical protein NL676_025469 [Syzygium grande]|nr:hypothetical protein NL676_025469 [Syzygium grande]
MLPPFSFSLSPVPFLSKSSHIRNKKKLLLFLRSVVFFCSDKTRSNHINLESAEQSRDPCEIGGTVRNPKSIRNFAGAESRTGGGNSVPYASEYDKRFPCAYNQCDAFKTRRRWDSRGKH